MPELFLPHGEYFRQFAPTANYKELDDNQERFGVEIIGEGTESIVVAQNENPQRAIAFAYKGLLPIEAKAQFYLQRVMSTLFPHNFPHFYATFAGPKASQSQERFAGSIRELIDPGSKPPEIKFFFKDALAASDAIGIPTDRLDLHKDNFITGADGGEYYIDNMLPLLNSMIEFDPDNSNWRLERILGYMEGTNRNAIDKGIVASSLIRNFSLLKRFKEKVEGIT